MSLSYDGDYRMYFGENPNKVKNIVAGQQDFLIKIYSKYIESFHAYLCWNPATDEITKVDSVLLP